MVWHTSAARSVNCAGCHNTRVSDTLNWNPDALEISKKYLHKSARDLSKILLKPVGQKMSQVHKGFQLTPEDIVLIKAYMDKFADIGLEQNKPVITNLLLFIIASVLFLFSIIDLIISKILKRRWINYAYPDFYRHFYNLHSCCKCSCSWPFQRIILRFSLLNSRMLFMPDRTEQIVFIATVPLHTAKLQEFPR